MSATAAAAIEMAKHFTAAPFAEFDPAGSFAKLNGKPIAAVKAGAIDPLMSKA